MWWENYYICGMGKLIKSIDVVHLGPYWPHGVCMMSVGLDEHEIWEFFQDSYECDKGPSGKRCRANYRRWRAFIFGNGMPKRLSDVNSMSVNIKGIFQMDCDLRDDPLLLMALSPDFDLSNPESMITLSHECIHICQRILPIYLNRDVEHEAEAYFHDYLMREAVRIVSENNVHLSKQ